MMIAVHEKAAGKEQRCLVVIFGRPILVGNRFAVDLRHRQAQTGRSFRGKYRQRIAHGGIGEIGARPPQPLRRTIALATAFQQCARNGRCVRFKHRFKFAEQPLGQRQTDALNRHGRTLMRAGRNGR